MMRSGRRGSARAACGHGRAAAIAALLAALPAAGARPEWTAAPGGGAAVGFCALLEALPPSRLVGEWRASGVAVHVGPQTTIDATQAAPALGVAAVVTGEALSDGSVRAARIALRAAGCGALPGPPFPVPPPAEPAVGAPQGVVGVGALAGSRPGSAGVAVATAGPGSHGHALSVAGLRPGERYDLAIDGARAATVVAADDGTVRAELTQAPLTAGARGARAGVHLELVDATGVVAVAGEIRAVTAPRDGSLRSTKQ